MKIGRLVGVAQGILWGALTLNGASMPRLRITIYDQAHLTREVSLTAFDQLGRVLRHVGIAIEIMAGDPAAEEASEFNYEAPPRPGQEREAFCGARRDVALQIISHSVPGLAPTVLGISSPLARSGLNVRVFSDHVLKAAYWHDRPYPDVLSYVMAHEIGHVLLRSGQHGGWGLMSSVWRQSEYARMGRGGVMFFTGDESREMRINLGGLVCPEPSAPTGLGVFAIR